MNELGFVTPCSKLWLPDTLLQGRSPPWGYQGLSHLAWGRAPSPEITPCHLHLQALTLLFPLLKHPALPSPAPSLLSPSSWLLVASSAAGSRTPGLPLHFPVGSLLYLSAGSLASLQD